MLARVVQWTAETRALAVADSGLFPGSSRVPVRQAHDFFHHSDRALVAQMSEPELDRIDAGCMANVCAVNSLLWR